MALFNPLGLPPSTFNRPVAPSVRPPQFPGATATFNTPPMNPRVLSGQPWRPGQPTISQNPFLQAMQASRGGLRQTGAGGLGSNPLGALLALLNQPQGPVEGLNPFTSNLGSQMQGFGGQTLNRLFGGRGAPRFQQGPAQQAQRRF
jgi:hypothetical protein